MVLDVKLLYFLNNLTGQSKFFDTLTVFIASYLQYFLAVAFLLLLYFSAYSKREKLYIFWTTTLSMTVARFGITEIIRFFYHRPRPFLTYQLHPLILDNEWSFPSGHSAFFFALAMAVYFYNKKWGIGFFMAAIVMNLSRVVAGVHYPSDILGGMIIGILTAYMVKTIQKYNTLNPFRVSKKLYQCKECGLHYQDREITEKCEAWCKEHKSCNIEITSQAEENKRSSNLHI